MATLKVRGLTPIFEPAQGERLSRAETRALESLPSAAASLALARSALRDGKEARASLHPLPGTARELEKRFEAEQHLLNARAAKALRQNDVFTAAKIVGQAARLDRPRQAACDVASRTMMGPRLHEEAVLAHTLIRKPAPGELVFSPGLRGAYAFDLDTMARTARADSDAVILTETRGDQTRMTRGRGLSEYDFKLSVRSDDNLTTKRRFLDALKGLSKEQSWLDVGCGRGHSLRDFAQEIDGPTATGIDLGTLDPEIAESLLTQPRIQFIQGHVTSLQGEEQFDVISDLFGALSYSRDLSGVLQRELDLLKLGGKLYVYLHPPQIVGGDGQFIPAKDWFESVKGARLTVSDQGRRLEFEKTDRNVRVPNLRLVGMEPGRPPVRTYAVPELTPES